jgi:hypothetical protein
MADIVRVTRIIQYVGEREWVEKTVSNSVHGTKVLPNGCLINAVTLNEFPEALTLENAKPTMEPENG